MRVRVVKSEEWPDLQQIGGLPSVMPNPVGSIVLVLEEEDGTPIGRWFATNTIALEGLFIREDYRGNPAAARKLLGTMLVTLKQLGLQEVVTLIQAPDVEELARKAKFEPLEGCLWRRSL